VDSNRDQGESATIGMENANGSVGFQYSYNELAAADGGITFRSDTGVTHGVVTDANDSEPVAGATVTVKAGGEVVDSATTGDDGDYLLQLPSGGYQLEVAKEHYEAATDSATVTGGEVGSVDTALRTARVEASAPELAIVAPAGETRSRTVTLSNTGGLGTDYSVVEATGSGEADIPWLSVESTTGTLAPGAQSQVRITVDATGMDASSYQGAQVLIRSASGRQPTVTVPVTIVAPGYRASLDAGATGDVVDSYGDTWNSDQEYQAGSCGYVGRSHTLSSNAEITGTSDDSRYQSLRRDMYEYRFDGLADGTYTVELDFAELEPVAPDKHLFDVHVEDTEVLRNFDVAYHGGSYAAVSRTFTVTVTDGQLNVRFFTHKGYGKPIINAIRVTDRPDLAA
ncbi:MAG: malectin domain-containing carbohydrate-binding protein, partial [Micromonosporaceae bacterium]